MTTPSNEALWHTIFAIGHPKLMSKQRWHRWLPAPPRCKLCLAPFRGFGGLVMRLTGKGPANRNPRYCSLCDKFIRAYPGGAEVELSMVFVDVRGSVTMAEKTSPTEFSEAMKEFYVAATKALYDTDGFIIDLVGDEAVGVYPPGFSGPDHARKAVQAAEMLLSTAPRTAEGSRLPIGVGVHTGVVFIGTMTGAEAGVEDVRTLGDNVNITSRLAAMARPGEALISDAAYAAARVNLGHLEHRQLELKGKERPITVRVMKAPAG